MLQRSNHRAANGESVAPADHAGARARDRDKDRDKDSAPLAGRWLAWGFGALCFAIALAAPDALFDVRELTFISPSWRAWTDWLLQLHWLLGVLVISPFAFTALIILDLHSLRAGRRFTLVGEALSTLGVPEPHAAQDLALWGAQQRAVDTSWEYEKVRIGRLQCRLVLQALLFGNVTTFAVMCSALAYRGGGNTALACSVAAAAVTAFFANLARILLRISGGDITTRTFSWALRSQILVIIADVGLFVLLGAAVQGTLGAVMLGIFVGATGDHAIQFMLDKASKLFDTGAVAPEQASPLLQINGITNDHVERLEEESIVSIQDLAFVPTARLFFSTTYSLQQICDWQDSALLHMRVGDTAAAALAKSMNIRGAFALMALAHDLLYQPPADVGPCREALCKALQIEPGALGAALVAVAHDEDAMRIRYYASATVAPDELAADGSPQVITLSRLVPVQPVAAQPVAAQPVAAQPGPPPPLPVQPAQTTAPLRSASGSNPPAPAEARPNGAVIELVPPGSPPR